MSRWLMFLSIIALALPTFAVDLRGGDTIIMPQGQVIKDDLVVGGGTIDIRSAVEGDLVVGGGTINIYSPVRGNLIIGGGKIMVAGPVGGSVYVGGGDVTLSSTVGRNVVTGCGTLRVDQSAVIGRDLALSSGSAIVSGTVNQDIKSSAGALQLTDTARVKRDLYQMGSAPTIAPGAIVSGKKIVQPGYQPKEHKANRWLKKIFVGLAMAIGFFIVGSVFVSVAPRLTEESESMVKAHPWASLLAGLVILIVVPFAAIILLVTVFGIPLAALLMFLYFAAIILSPVILAVWAGRLVLRKSPSIYLALLVGLILYLIIRLIPIIGGLMAFVVILIGIGALFLAWQGRSKNPIYSVQTVE